MSEKNDEAGKENKAPPAGKEKPGKADVPVKGPAWLEPEYAGPLTGTQALARLAKFGHDVQTKPTEKASTK